MKAIGLDFSEREWLWRVFMHPEQTTLVKGKHPNRFFQTRIRIRDANRIYHAQEDDCYASRSMT